MTTDALKMLCDDVQLACAEGYPAGCDQAVQRVCTASGRFRDGLTVRLARAASVLLDQLAWHEQRAAQLRSRVVPLNAVDFAEVHEAATARIRAALEAL